MSLRRSIALYGLIFCATLALASALLWLATQPRRFAPDPGSRLPGKTAFYLAHAQDFDLIFLGDSRTFCAFHPERLDPLLGSHSFNLAYWANWLPTQFPQVQAIAGRVPPGATLVWSLGENNFARLTIHDTYPIGLANVPRYLGCGIPFSELADNLMAFNPLTYLYAKRGALLDHARALTARPLAQAALAFLPRPGQPGQSDPSDLQRRFAARPGVLRAEVQAPQGTPVAVSLFMAGGGYLLEELDPAHFRARQTHAESATPAGPYTPDASRWALFLATLDLLRRHGLSVVVNVLEEAPYLYPSRGAQLRVRAFMDTALRREVEARGFSYLRTDLDQLSDADYFDYNHLNARGVEKYTALFARALAPHLKRPDGR